MDQRPEDPEVFEQPDDLNGYIWRYMDLSKFIALLHGNLYFPRADRLGDDEYECTVPRGNSKQPIESYKIFTNVLDDENFDQTEFVKKYEDNLVYIAEQVRQTCYVSCWHMNQHESAAMWKLYLAKNEGVAIRSSTQRLLNVTAKHRGAIQAGHPRHIGVGKVKYIDFEHDPIPSNSALHLVMHKRHSFSHEQELRAVHCGLHHPGEICQEPGRDLPVDLSELIEHVFVAPTSPSWFEHLVKDLVEQRFGLNLPVDRSAMSRGPLK